MKIYECGICGGYHPWDWNGDCREDKNRYSCPEEYAERNNLNINDIEVESMANRVEEDNRYGMET